MAKAKKNPRAPKRKPRPPPAPLECFVVELISPVSLHIQLGPPKNLLWLRALGTDPTSVELHYGGITADSLLHVERVWLPKNRFPKPKEVIEFAEDILIPNFMDKMRAGLRPRGGFTIRKAKS